MSSFLIFLSLILLYEWYFFAWSRICSIPVNPTLHCLHSYRRLFPCITCLCCISSSIFLNFFSQVSHMCFLNNSDLIPRLILFVPTPPTQLSFNLPLWFWIVTNKTHLFITDYTKVQFLVIICFFLIITTFTCYSSWFHIPLPSWFVSFAFADNLFSTDRTVAGTFFKPPFFLLFF